MPDCPKCRTALVRRRNDFGVFWNCNNCEGSAVSTSLLRKMIPAKAMNGLWQRARLGSYPRKHRCPGCNRAMEEISVEAEGQARAIDVCTSCQFIWLDEGEWKDLAFFEVEKTSPEAIREAVRDRIAQKRKERSAPAADLVTPPPLQKKVQPQKTVVHSASIPQPERITREKPPPISKRSPEKRSKPEHDSGATRRRERQQREAAEEQRRRRREAPKQTSGWGNGPTAFWQWFPALLGMPVEDEQPAGPRQLDEKPWLTWFLATAIVLVSLLALLDLQRVVDSYGLIPAEYGRKNGLTWITAFFLHGGLLHLIGNVYFLVVFGDNVEKCLGTIEFFLLLCLATVSGHFFHILLDPDSTIPCIGASGGISGVIAFYALRFPHHQLAVMFWFIFKTYWLRMSAMWMFCIWVILQIFIANQQIAGLSHVSGGAHLGGALAGAFAWLVWRLNHASRYSSEGGWATK